ncbi:hypothetical protein [Marinomonas ostreistagni]|nr:hypothetical protein [Marinomonas ostreistagni]
MNDEHRIVYRCDDYTLIIMQLRYHYGEC